MGSHWPLQAPQSPALRARVSHCLCLKRQSHRSFANPKLQEFCYRIFSDAFPAALAFAVRDQSPLFTLGASPV